MPTLCLDFGNTRKKYAIVEKGNLISEGIFDFENVNDIEHLIVESNADKSILSSVVDHSPEVEDVLKNYTHFHKLSIESKLPITSPVGKPQTIGADRLATAVAAITLYPMDNNLVIVLGSCITYNFITKNHEFIGGSISPGMEMRFKALNQFTARLPRAEAEWNIPVLGYDTKTNIQSGVIYGIAAEIDGIIDLYKEKFNKFNVHLTGGDTPFFGSLIKNKIFADPYLIYKGLYAISEYNQ